MANNGRKQLKQRTVTYLIKQLKLMGFKEEILMYIYRSITLSQYLCNAPLLGSASPQAKKEMETNNTDFST
jgi:hypothetical protein